MCSKNVNNQTLTTNTIPSVFCTDFKVTYLQNNCKRARALSATDSLLSLSPLSDSSGLPLSEGARERRMRSVRYHHEELKSVGLMETDGDHQNWWIFDQFS